MESSREHLVSPEAQHEAMRADFMSAVESHEQTRLEKMQSGDSSVLEQHRKFYTDLLEAGNQI